MHNKKSHLTMAVVLVAATMLIAGSVAVASNTGFKINKPLAVVSGLAGQNWTSLPFFNPYGNGTTICASLGLISTGLVRGQLLKIDPVSGAALNANCGNTAQTNTFTLFPGQGVRIQNGGIGAPTSAIIVGSHNPALSITIPDTGAGNVGTLWFSVPYHTTWITGADICNSLGMTSTGVARGSVARLNASTGALTPANCGSTQATSLTLVLGEAVRLREPNGPISFVPSHF